MIDIPAVSREVTGAGPVLSAADALARVRHDTMTAIESRVGRNGLEDVADREAWVKSLEAYIEKLVRLVAALQPV